MNWHHIQDKRPEHGREIIQLDAPYQGHWPMGMRKYEQQCAWEGYCKWREFNDLPLEDWYWVYAEDFPFPERKESL